MNDSGSLCPAMKAAEIIGDKWTLLILRELFLGSSKFGDFQRGLPRISPTILTLRSDRRKKDGVAEFEREDLDRERTEVIFKELAMLAFDLSQARIQLVHWYAA